MKNSLKNYTGGVGFLLIAAVSLCVFVASQFNMLHGFQNKITEVRASLSQRSASGDVVFIGIDKESLDHVGVWPWPRTVHAQIVDYLMAQDVTEIGIDIDFSAASTPANDLVFEKSLERAGGAVILPTFVQDRSISDKDNTLSINSPIPIFAQHSWLATVNVVPDSDGVVRRFPIGHEIEGAFIASMPSVLSGASNTTQADVPINFSIDPKTIPMYSVVDLLTGKVGRKELEGKSVLLGAQAVELRDNFTVPVYGALPGAVIQLLTTETLLQGIELNTLNPLFLILFFALIVFISSSLISKFASNKMLRLQFFSLAVIAGIFEVAGFILYKNQALVLPTAELLTFTVLFAVVIGLREINIQRFKFLFADTNRINTQNVLDQIVNDNANGILIIDEMGCIFKANKNAKLLFNMASIDKDSVLEIGTLPKIIERDVKRAIALLKEQNVNAPILGRVRLVIGNNEEPSTLEYAITASKLQSVAGAGDLQYLAGIAAWDITKRLAQEQKIAYLAKYDELTGAFRRGAFENSVNEKLSKVSKNNDVQTCYSILAVNLHRFKTINVTLGHEIGDQVLCASFERLKNFSQDIKQISRFGGDTFAVYVSNDFSQIELETFCNNLIEHMVTPLKIGKATMQLGLRIGSASSSSIQNLDAAKILANAELALDEARQVSGNNFVAYCDDISKRIDYSRSVESELWHALERNEIYVAYQPQVDIISEELIGVEALIRWDNPKLGFVSPETFVNIAETNGFLDKLGAWIINKACDDALKLPDHVSVAVNVAPTQFMHADVAAIVDDALKRTGLPARRLHIEITETGLLDNTDDVVNSLEKLNAMGITIALDDFGTGHSSLGYFANFPIDKIKVDQMFVRTLERGSDNEAIIRSVKELSNGLNLTMICEGIETQDQMLLLREIGVHQGQGYLFGKPLPLEAIIEISQVPQKLRA